MKIDRLKSLYDSYWDRNPGDIGADSKTHRRCRLLARTLAKGGSMGSGLVLDAGCGEGYFSNYFVEMGYRVVSVDISRKAVERARHLYPGINFQISSLEDGLSFKNGIFDVVWSCEVIEHVYDVTTYMTELNRVLKPNGLSIITTPYHGLLKNMMVVLFRFDHHFGNLEDGHIRFFSDKALEKLFGQFGFEVIEKKYVGRFWPISNCVYVVGRKVRDA